MIFNEIYSAYYNAVARIITALLEGSPTEKELSGIVEEHAFGESMLTILPSLKSGKWPLMHPDGTTPLRHRPTMPLTLDQKRWLKAITLDPRFSLFGVEIPGLEAVEPLFTPEDYYIYDRYADGDPYTDEGYIARFRAILSALRAGKELQIEMINRKGKRIRARCLPKRLEYSEKDDKFRLVTAGCRFFKTVNLARLTQCTVCEGDSSLQAEPAAPVYDTVTLRVQDERNAPERCMLHFAHFAKRVEKTGDGPYLLHIKYDREDQTEMVIRILSFGPLVEVLEPQSFRDLIVDRLRKQKSCELF